MTGATLKAERTSVAPAESLVSPFGMIFSAPRERRMASVSGGNAISESACPHHACPAGRGELYELYRHLFRVVGEGFHDIALMIDHRELLRCERQKRALKEDGKKNDEEGDMEDDVIHRRLRISDDGQYDGRGAEKACEGDQSACGSGRFERGKESEDAEGPCHEGQEERDEGRQAMRSQGASMAWREVQAGRRSSWREE